jgi:hypothetical protein
MSDSRLNVLIINKYLLVFTRTTNSKITKIIFPIFIRLQKLIHIIKNNIPI